MKTRKNLLCLCSILMILSLTLNTEMSFGITVEDIQVISTSSAQVLANNVEIDNDGNIHVTWAEGGAGNYDVMHRMWDVSLGTWSSVVKAYDSGTISQSVSSAIDQAGDVHVVFMEGPVGPSQWIQYTKRYKSMAFWSSAAEISPPGGDSEYPTIAIDSNQNVVIVWGDTADILGSATDRDVLVYYNPGEGYTTHLVSSESYSDSSRPDVAVDSQGIIHVVWEDKTEILDSGTDVDVFYKYFNPDSKTWSSPTLITAESSVDSTYPCLTTDSNDNVYVVWTEQSSFGESGSDRDIFLRKYDWRLEYWGDIEVVSVASEVTSNRPCITADPSNNIHIAWDDYFEDTEGIDHLNIYYRVKNKKAVWGETQLISVNCTDLSLSPDLKSDYSGNIHIVWSDQTNIHGAGTDRDVFYCKLDAIKGVDFSIVGSIMACSILVALVLRKRKK